jgi:hypothetical protein
MAAPTTAARVKKALANPEPSTQGLTPKLQGSDVLSSHRRFPLARIATENPLRCSGSDAAPSMFAGDEKLGHVVLDTSATGRRGIQERKAHEALVHPQKQWKVCWLAPIDFERILRKPAVIFQFATRCPAPLFREIVVVELNQIFDRTFLVGTSD